jgi:hypothetical protein
MEFCKPSHLDQSWLCSLITRNTTQFLTTKFCTAWHW